MPALYNGFFTVKCLEALLNYDFFADPRYRQHPGTYHHDCIPYLDDWGRSIIVCSGEFI